MLEARNRSLCRHLEEAYVQQWTSADMMMMMIIIINKKSLLVQKNIKQHFLIGHSFWIYIMMMMMNSRILENL